MGKRSRGDVMGVLEISQGECSPVRVRWNRALDVFLEERRGDCSPPHRSSIIVSLITFVLPYGLSAFSRVVSGMGIIGGVP